MATVQEQLESVTERERQLRIEADSLRQRQETEKLSSDLRIRLRTISTQITGLEQERIALQSLEQRGVGTLPEQEQERIIAETESVISRRTTLSEVREAERMRVSSERQAEWRQKGFQVIGVRGQERFKDLRSGRILEKEEAEEVFQEREEVPEPTQERGQLGTPTEIELRQSLPPELRDLPAREVRHLIEEGRRRQSIPRPDVVVEGGSLVEFKTGRIIGTAAQSKHFLEQRIIDTFKPKGSSREVPITKVFVVDEEGNIVRDATEKEQEEFRKSSRFLKVPEDREGLEGFRQDIEEKRGELLREEPGFLRESQGFGFGIAESLVGTAIFTKSLVTDPKQTALQLGQAGEEVFVRVKSQTFFPEVGRVLRTEPGFATGFVVGEALTIKGISLAPKLIVKGTDIVRTAGLRELPTKQIVAPEFFEGQPFPKLKKGETAEQLKLEFSQFKLPGETKPAGFTAAPRPFKGETLAGKGSSELPGVFQSPDISPHFLRISGEEKKFFSFNPFDTFRPSVIRITPKEFRLAEGVSPGQKKLKRLTPEFKESFKAQPLGVSTIPFIKLEKEAIITAGTPLIQKGRVFFFKFEGRRIPIQQFQIDDLTKAQKGKGKTDDLTKGQKGKGKTIEEISSIVSSRRIGKRGVVSSLDLSSISRLSRVSRPSKSISSRRFSQTPSSGFVSKVSSKTTPPFKITSSLIGKRSRSPIVGLSSSLQPPGGGGSSTGDLTTGFPLIPVGGKTPFRFSTTKPTRKRQPKGVSVFLRRFGTFRPIGTGLSLGKAFELGTQRAGRTLAATFKVTGADVGRVPTPRGFRRKVTPTGTEFIELPKFRLSTPTEIREIQRARRSKKKRKKK